VLNSRRSYPLFVLAFCLTWITACNVAGRPATATPALMPPLESTAPALAAVPSSTATTATAIAPVSQLSPSPIPLPATDAALPAKPLPTGTTQPTAAPTPPTESTATATPRPTVAPSPTTELSPTPSPSITTEPSPTPAAIATLLAGGSPRVSTTLLSPDGRYRAEVLIYGCAELGEEGDAYELLRIIDTGNGQEHVIADQYHACMGAGGFGLDVLFWDPGSRFVYFTTARQGGPDGAGISLGRPMLRAGVTDWAVANLGNPVGAPDVGRYAGWLDGELIIWAIDGTVIGRTPPAPDYPELGLPAWSPDGAHLAYFQLSESLSAGGGNINTIVFVVDSATLERRVAFESDALPIFEISWLDDGRLLLRGFDRSWHFDMATETLSDAPQ
jgi:hypothetical protein